MMIQLLPISFTADRGNWSDSYPYRQIFCFALNPIYINLLEITEKLPIKLEAEIREFGESQEKLNELDYPTVYAFKVEKLQQIY